jgi:hypothetical protein
VLHHANFSEVSKTPPQETQIQKKIEFGAVSYFECRHCSWGVEFVFLANSYQRQIHGTTAMGRLHQWCIFFWLTSTLLH